MTRPTLTPAQTRALMWLDGEWALVPGSGHTNSCRALSSVGLGLADPRRTYTSFESYRLTPAGLALKATLQREQSADTGTSDTEMLDWVEREKVCVSVGRHSTTIYEADTLLDPIATAATVRDALRAAMQSDPSTSAAAARDNETSRG